MGSSTSPSYPDRYDSQNQYQRGINNGQTPFVPQPLGSSTAPISHLPPPSGLLPSPGQLQLGSPTQTGNYLIASNSLPIMGREYFPQVGNLSLSSHNSLCWCQGLRQDRNPSPSPEFASRVCQSSTSNDFQRGFAVRGPC